MRVYYRCGREGFVWLGPPPRVPACLRARGCARTKEDALWSFVKEFRGGFSRVGQTLRVPAGVLVGLDAAVGSVTCICSVFFT